MRNVMAGMIFATLSSAAPLAIAETRDQVPTVYEAGHFFVTPPDGHGGKLRLLVDSGGSGARGMFVMYAGALKRAGWPVRSCHFAGTTAKVTDAPPSVRAMLPNGTSTPCGASAFVNEEGSAMVGEDGLIGAGYLPNSTFTFDYPGQKLWREASGWKPAKGSRSTPLSIPRTADGLAGGLPLFHLVIDGQTIPMLLDTGATAKPSANGKRETGIETVNGFGVASYVPHRLFEKWHAAHPDWQVVDDGDELISHTRLIRVPEVRVAGWSVGPAWFTERSDANIDFLNDYTTDSVSGSAGANIFKHFRMTLDYAQGAAWFDCVTGCKAVGESATP